MPLATWLVPLLLVALGVTIWLVVERIQAGDRISTQPRDLEVGDCLDDSGWDEDTSERLHIVVPCNDPHTREVFAQVAWPDGKFPGERVLAEGSGRYCEDDFAVLTELTSPRELTTSWGYRPTPSTWSDGYRMITCIADAGSQMVHGSMTRDGNVGAERRLGVRTPVSKLGLGVCINPGTEHFPAGSEVEVLVRPCELLHSAEVIARVAATADDGGLLTATEACEAWLNQHTDDADLNLKADGYPPPDPDVEHPTHTCYVAPTANIGLFRGHLLRD